MHGRRPNVAEAGVAAYRSEVETTLDVMHDVSSRPFAARGRFWAGLESIAFGCSAPTERPALIEGGIGLLSTIQTATLRNVAKPAACSDHPNLEKDLTREYPSEKAHI